MENVKLGKMINYWIEAKGSIDLDTSEKEIKEFYEQNHRGPIKFKYGLRGNKESIYDKLSSSVPDYGLGLSEKEIEENDLVYSFYEVEFDCVFENGKIYITHCNGKKLEERVLA